MPSAECWKFQLQISRISTCVQISSNRASGTIWDGAACYTLDFRWYIDGRHNNNYIPFVWKYDCTTSCRWIFKTEESWETFISSNKVAFMREEGLTDRSQPLLQPLRTSLVFWCAGSGETADLPWPSCTDFSDVHSHDWLWNLALKTKGIKQCTHRPCTTMWQNWAQTEEWKSERVDLHIMWEDRNEMTKCKKL